MTNAELIQKIRNEIERRKGYISVTHFAKELLSFLSTLESEKPIQDGLEEEIQRFLSNATKMDKGEWKGKYPISEMGFGVVARHFAQWGAEQQKKQMMKEAVEGTIDYVYDEKGDAHKAIRLDWLVGDFGDKVRIIIVKED